MSNPPDNTTFFSTLRRVWGFARMLWRRVENVVFVVVMLLVGLYFLLQMPSVQNWLLGRAAAYFSEQLDTKVTLRHVDIVFFDQFSFSGFYVEDLRGDTLLYADELNIGLNTNIFSLLSNRLDVNELSLKRASVNIRRDIGERQDNLSQLLARLIKKKSSNNGPDKPFPIRIQHCRLRDIALSWDDAVKGERMKAHLPFGDIQINTLDIPANIFDIRAVNLEGLAFDWADVERHPLPPDPISAHAKSKVNDTPPLQFSLGQFSLTGAKFRLDEFRSSTTRHAEQKVIDFEHINVQNIDIQLVGIHFTDSSTFEGRLKNLSLREQSGFELSHLEAGRVVVSPTLTGLYEAKLQTPRSSLGDTILFRHEQYSDFNDFEDRVGVDFSFQPGSYVGLGDLMFFDKKIANNKFFQTRQIEAAEIAGHFSGKLAKRLRGEAVEIKISDDTYARGKFRAEGLIGEIDKSILEFEFERLQANFKTISRIIPNFRPPKSFYKLGNVAFSGEYQIFYGFSHILHGKLLSDIGNGAVDMNLDMKNGREKATYSGNLKMQDFDLAAWTGNTRDFKTISFNVDIEEGSSGLTLPTIKAKIDGGIQHFYFKGYDYQNFTLKGDFKEYVFDGTLGISDPNIVFNFDGNVNLRDTIPQFLFKADLKRLDVNALNLLNEDWVLSGKVEQMRLSGRSWRDLNGTAMLRDVKILEIGESENYTHRIDSLRFISTYNAEEGNYFAIRSNLMEGELKGKFDLTKVVKNLRDIFTRHHPKLSTKLGLPAPDSIVSDDKYQLRLNIKDLQRLPKLLSLGVDTLYDIRADVAVDALKGQTKLSLQAPEVKSGSISLKNINLNWLGLRENAQLSLNIPASTVSGSKLSPITLQGLLTQDELNFKLNAEDTSKIVRAVNLDGVLSVVDSLWQVQFNSSDIALFNTEWVMSDDNYIRFNDN
jgi:hypothetical protein